MATSGPHTTIAGVKARGKTYLDNMDDLVGQPDGPMKFIPEFGFEVPTYLDPRTDLYKEKDPGKTSLMHHIPINKRGFYKPHQTADYDPDEYDYIVDGMGWAVCTSTTAAGNPCSRRAANYSWLCGVHGGKLHPLNKIQNDDRDSMQVKGGGWGNAANPEVIERMTRLQKLAQGIISVDDLDDEELARGQCRGRDGKFAGLPPRQIPHGLHQRMVNELFKRADEKLQHSLINVVETMVEVANGDAYEPADRIKAATWIFERVRGKNPDVVIHSQDKPWEMALGHITMSEGTRAESRQARGLDPETGEPVPMALVPANETPEQKRLRLLAELSELDESEGIIDAEVEDEGDLAGVEAEVEYVDGEVAHADSEADDEGWSNKPGEDGAYDPEPKDIAKAKEALAERLKAGRRQRGFARKNGQETIQVTPYLLVEKGPAPDGGYFVGFKKQSTPRKKRGNDDFRHRI